MIADIWVLIIVINTFSQLGYPGITIINQEFVSRERCEAARLKIVADILQNRTKVKVEIISSGCYQK